MLIALFVKKSYFRLHDLEINSLTSKMTLNHINNIININNNNNNNKNNKGVIYRGYRYIQQRTKSIKIKNIHACMYQPTEHISFAVGPSYINIKKHTLIYIYLNNIMISR